MLTGCHPRIVTQLPAEPDLEADRLLLFLHGYFSSSDVMTRFVDVLARQGIPKVWLEPGASPAARVRYHAHSFDFSRFTRAGSDQNTSEEALAEAFAEFYHSLHDSCPVCRRRMNRPVQVTLIAHSFGGLIAREFLMQEADRHPLLHDIPGEGRPPTPWSITRVISLGTPWFGSVRTRFTTGLQSIVVNGLVRTLVLGFVRPEAGGTFGNVIDAQARALRIGSPYLWLSHERWVALARRLARSGQSLPPWLVVTAIGGHSPELSGDGITRFTSANLAPVAPDLPLETLVMNLRHTRLVKLKARGRPAREQAYLLRAVARFVERGTLAGDPARALIPYAITGGTGRDELLPPQQEQAQGVEASDSFVRQRIYLENPPAAASLEQQDLRDTLSRLTRILRTDVADVWLRFYEGVPEGTGEETPRVLSLSAALSFFQNGVERSRDWTDLVSRSETNAAGEQIPVVQYLAPMRSHLITIPDLTPTGAYRLWIRLTHGIRLTPDLVRVRIEGQPAGMPAQSMSGPGIPLWIRPHQANLVHVYLDGTAIRRAYPELDLLKIREVALIPE